MLGEAASSFSGTVPVEVSLGIGLLVQTGVAWPGAGATSLFALQIQSQDASVVPGGSVSELPVIQQKLPRTCSLLASRTCEH